MYLMVMSLCTYTTHRQNTLLVDALAVSAPLPGDDGAGLDMVSYRSKACTVPICSENQNGEPKLTQNGEPKTKMEKQEPKWRTKNQNGEPKNKMENQKQKGEPKTKMENQKSKSRTKNQNGEPKTKMVTTMHKIMQLTENACSVPNGYIYVYVMA